LLRWHFYQTFSIIFLSRMPRPQFSPLRRRYGLLALSIGYVGHLVGSLMFPEWRAISIVGWFLALFGGAVYCAETLKKLRLT
jgi:hypothetical protein